MALNLNITPVVAPTITGLSAVSTLKGVLLTWDALADDSLFAVEVWMSSTNDRNAATLIKAVTSNYFLHAGLASNTTFYYWVRARNIHGRTDGAWTPVSSTAGTAVTTLLTQTADIAQNAATSIINVQSSSLLTQTAYETWERPFVYSLYGTGSQMMIDIQHVQDHTLTTIGTTGKAACENLFQIVEHQLYSVGAVNVTNGSAVVTGVGTSWLANAAAGMTFYSPTSGRYTIASVNSDTQITLVGNYAGATTAGQAYHIFTVTTLVSQIQQEVASFEIRGTYCISGQLPYSYRFSMPSSPNRIYDCELFWRITRSDASWALSQRSLIRILTLEEIKR